MAVDRDQVSSVMARTSDSLVLLARCSAHGSTVEKEKTVPSPTADGGVLVKELHKTPGTGTPSRGLRQDESV